MSEKDIEKIKVEEMMGCFNSGAAASKIYDEIDDELKNLDYDKNKGKDISELKTQVIARTQVMDNLFLSCGVNGQRKVFIEKIIELIEQDKFLNARVILFDMGDKFLGKVTGGF